MGRHRARLDRRRRSAGKPDGAEDSVYTSQTPPYRTGNWPMMSPSELMNMPGFGADRYRKIAPYVTALPTATAKINVCTAPAPVLESLADNLSGEYTTRGAGQRPQDRLLSRYTDLQQRARTHSGAGNRESIRGQEPVFPPHDPRHAWHYGVHLVQSFVARERRQGDAAAAHFRNTLTHMPQTLLLRLPAPGQEETEWLGIDEAGRAEHRDASAGP